MKDADFWGAAFTQAQATVLILIMMCVTPYKAGMSDWTLPLLMSATWVMLVLAYARRTLELRVKTLQKPKPSRTVAWLAPWIAVSVVCAIHLVFKSAITQNWLQDFDSITLWPLGKPSGWFVMAELKRLTLNSWAYFTVFWGLSYCVAHLNRPQVKQVLWAVVLIGFFQAVAGVYWLQLGSTDVLGLWTKQYYLSDATGTFVNRNHFANFLVICLALGLAGFMGRRLLLIAKNPWLSYGLGFCYAGVLMAAILSSHSRMGLMVALIAVSVWLIGRGTANRYVKRRWVVPLIGIFFLILMMLWFGVGETLERFMELENNSDGRWQIWSNLMQLPQSAWLWGVGPGNFSDVYALIKPANSKHAFSFAHNDYLEFLVEYGVVGSLACLGAGVFWWFKVKPARIIKQSSTLRMAALAALIAVLIHAVVDFSLRIPANMVFTAVALGLLLNEVRQMKKRSSQ